MSPNLVAPIVIAPLIAWRLYARSRRHFGRQPIQPGRMWTRVGILSAITLLVATGGFVDPRLAAGLGAGLAGGVALALLALKLTRFEIDGRADCYYPNPWIGLALTALFIGRVLYRFLVLWPELSLHSAGSFEPWQHSPLTLVTLGLMLGYYIAYYGGLLIHHRNVLATRPAV
jgi:hypothetical protein